MKLQTLYFSNGNRYTGGISHRLSVTSSARLFTNNKNLKNDNTYGTTYGTNDNTYDITPMEGFDFGKKAPLS